MGLTTQTSADPEIAGVLAAEVRRCAAISNRDPAALGELLSAELNYMHSTGLREGKADFITTTTGGTPRAFEREELDVRVFGDVAVTTGDYEVRIEPEDGYPDGRRVLASGLQVWRREDGQWRLLAHQGTARPATDGS